MAHRKQKTYRMARPQAAKPRKHGAPAKSQDIAERFRLGKILLAALSGPVGQQLLSIGLILFGLVTLATLAGLNTGILINSWARFLVYVFGWGAYVMAASFTALGLMWMRHLVHQPTRWRWRPVVGFEMTLFGMLALTHVLMQNKGWYVVQSGRGGGLIGWALSFSFVYYTSPLITAFLMIAVVMVGVGLAFDITGQDFRRWSDRIADAWDEYREAREAMRAAQQAEESAARETASVARSPIRKRREESEEPLPDPLIRQTEIKPQPAQQPPAKEPPPPARPAALPPLNLLREARPPALSQEEVNSKSRIIEQTLAQFGLPADVTEVRQGPTVTQFGVTPGYIPRDPEGRDARKVRVSQIAALADDLKLALAARSLRVQAPVPGRAVVGIEVPNEDIALVTLRQVMESKDFAKCSKPLCFAVGLDVAGGVVAADLSAMPHLLIAGTTGSGKSIFVKALAAGLILRNSPETLRLIAIDPKLVELSHLNGLPHLLGRAEIELEHILKALRWVAMEMDKRYKTFAKVAARNLDHYNRSASRKGEPQLPRIVVLIDELADLMMVAPEETERTLTRIAQMARATGIHLVVATQRPSTDVVTGLIKANFPARVSFATASGIDSRVILDTPGAESLLGRGDMLFLPPEAAAPRRVQGCYISEPELEALMKFWQRSHGATPAQAPWEVAIQENGPAQLRIEGETEDADLLEKAIAYARSRGEVSTSGIQRRFRISYPRAARIMEEMEAMGLVGPQESAGRKRQVILGGEED
ncbi:MAG: DNA translocase FtsK 4TM domain-containing protein [Anaerolineae bacterium]|nr:DNA translocase FtsK 4TM domain-containing protein [Anaerolineae bacterium]